MDKKKFTYSFSGKILPERAVVNLPLVVHVLATKDGNMPEGWEVTVSIVNSQLAVTLKTPELVEDIHDMREKVEGIVRYCVDALGFILACGYDVEITQVMAIDTISHFVFGVDVQGVTEKNEYTFEEIDTQFQNMLRVSPFKQQSLRRALVDFREAIRSHEDTPFFCFRAIEDLRQSFVSGKKDDVKKTWQQMSSKLNIPSETIDFVWNTLRPVAINIRHGEGTRIERETRVQMLRITWDIVNRYVSAEIEEPNQAEAAA